MHPILFKIGPLIIRTYGLFVALGLFFGLQYILRQAKNVNISEEKILDVTLYSIITGLLGARINYVLLNWPYYSVHPGDIFRIWEGGLVFYGGFIAGTVALAVFSKYYKLDILKLTDLFAPALAMGHFFGRIGCFFAGCCYGIPCSLPWAVRYKDIQSLAPLNSSLHPVQIYEALGNLVIFVFLYLFSKKTKVDGRVFAVYIIMYSVFRFGFEYLRGDDRGASFLGLSPAQNLSFVGVLAGIYIFKMRKNEK